MPTLLSPVCAWKHLHPLLCRRSWSDAMWNWDFTFDTFQFRFQLIRSPPRIERHNTTEFPHCYFWINPCLNNLVYHQFVLWESLPICHFVLLLFYSWYTPVVFKSLPSGVLQRYHTNSRETKVLPMTLCSQGPRASRYVSGAKFELAAVYPTCRRAPGPGKGAFAYTPLVAWWHSRRAPSQPRQPSSPYLHPPTQHYPTTTTTSLCPLWPRTMSKQAHINLGCWEDTGGWIVLVDQRRTATLPSGCLKVLHTSGQFHVQWFFSLWLSFFFFFQFQRHYDRSDLLLCILRRQHVRPKKTKSKEQVKVCCD